MEPPSFAGHPSAAPAGRVYLDHRHGIFLGQAPPSSLHAVHSVMVIVALEGHVRARLGGGEWGDATSLVIPSHHDFAAAGSSGPCAVFFVHPETVGPLCRPSVLRVSRPGALPAALEHRVRAALRNGVGRDAAPDIHGLTTDLVDRLQRETPDAELVPLDRRVARLIRALETEGGDQGHDALATIAGLSAGRLTHLFREQVGLSLRAYLVWLRGRVAVRRLASGESVTAIAHEAGFADAAHFARTSRRLIGMPVSHLRRDVQVVLT